MHQDHVIGTCQVCAAGTMLQGQQQHIDIGLGSLKIRQRPRTRVDGAVQARVADAEVVKGTSDVRQKRIPLAKDDTFGLGESE